VNEKVAAPAFSVVFFCCAIFRSCSTTRHKSKVCVCLAVVFQKDQIMTVVVRKIER